MLQRIRHDRATDQPLCLSWIPPRRQSFHLLLQSSQHTNSPLKAFQAKLAFSIRGHLPSHPVFWGAKKIPWRRAWQPTPVFFPVESHGQRSLAGYSPRGCSESGTTERQHAQSSVIGVSFLGGACVWLSMVNWKPSSF